MSTSLVKIVLVAGAIGFGGAQGGGTGDRWWRDQRLVEELALSDEQLSQIEQLSMQNAKSEIDLRAELMKMQIDMATVLEADMIDEAKAGAMIDRMGATRARLMKSQIAMLAGLQKMLTADQWKKLRESGRLNRPGAQGGGMRGPMQHGGPGGGWQQPPGPPGGRGGPAGQRGFQGQGPARPQMFMPPQDGGVPDADEFSF